MDGDATAQEIAQRLAARQPAGATAAPLAARAWAELRRRAQGDALAAAIITLCEHDAASADMQRRLAGLLGTYFSAEELHKLLVALRGTAAGPQVRSRINADEDALIQSSGHKVVGPPGPLDLETHAGKRGRIIDSPITIIGASTPSQKATPPSARARPALPATLSADGTHFSYGHALLIGVGSYQRAALSVETTAADAVQLGALLCDPQCGGYPPAQVRVLSDAQATRAGMLAAFAAFAQQLAQAPRATAIVFFAGHGQQRGDDFFLLPHDYNPDAVDASAISAAEFHACIAALRPHAQKLLVVLNCCHSGGIGAAVLGTGAAGGAADGTAGATPPAAFYQPLVAGSGQVVISAARPGQKAGADAWSAPAHTLFGARLLAALRGQAPGDAPGIGVFELFGYLSTHVPADARQIHYNGAPLAQEPLLYAHQLDTNIAIALRPNWQGGTLAADLATTLEALVQAEIELASYAREADAPAALQQRRDALLAQLARAEPEH